MNPIEDKFNQYVNKKDIWEQEEPGLLEQLWRDRSSFVSRLPKDVVELINDTKDYSSLKLPGNFRILGLEGSEAHIALAASLSYNHQLSPDTLISQVTCISEKNHHPVSCEVVIDELSQRTFGGRKYFYHTSETFPIEFAIVALTPKDCKNKEDIKHLAKRLSELNLGLPPIFCVVKQDNETVDLHPFREALLELFQTDEGPRLPPDIKVEVIRQRSLKQAKQVLASALEKEPIFSLTDVESDSDSEKESDSTPSILSKLFHWSHR